MRNGLLIKIGIPVVVFAAGYGALQAQVINNGKNTTKLEKYHNEDVKEINGNLKTLVELVQNQAVMNGKMQTTMEFIQKDISEIKAR